MKGILISGLLLSLSLSFAGDTAVDIASAVYQKGYKEGYEKGYSRGYVKGYIDALQDAKVLLKVLKLNYQATKAYCEYVADHYGKVAGVAIVDRNGERVIETFPSKLFSIDDWRELKDYSIPIIDVALAIKAKEAYQRLVQVPKLSQEMRNYVSTPPVRNYIVKLPKTYIPALKQQNISFIEEKGTDKVIALFPDKETLNYFCQKYGCSKEMVK